MKELSSLLRIPDYFPDGWLMLTVGAYVAAGVLLLGLWVLVISRWRTQTILRCALFLVVSIVVAMFVMTLTLNLILNYASSGMHPMGGMVVFAGSVIVGGIAGVITLFAGTWFTGSKRVPTKEVAQRD